MTQQEPNEQTRAMPSVVGDGPGVGSSPPDATGKAPSTQRPSVGGIPPGGALLLVVGDDLDAEYFVLTGEDALIGRSPDASVLLDDVTVSRQHAKIVKDRENWVVNDLRSLNGTYLNRERVEKGRLSDGDELQIGKFRFVFVLPEVTSG